MKTTAFAIAAGFALSVPANAQVVVDPACSVSEAQFRLALGAWNNASDCRGWYDAKWNNAAFESAIETAMEGGWGFTDATQLYKVDGPDDPEWSTSETFFLNNTYTNFVVAIKASNFHGMFLYEGTADQFRYDFTEIENAGSHYRVWGGEATRVPEPGSLMLLATGLFGIAAVRRRRALVD